MKTIVFIILSIIASLYLVLQYDQVSTFANKVFDKQKVEQNTEQVVKTIDNQLQQLAERYASAHAETIEELNTKVALLEQELDALKLAQQSAQSVVDDELNTPSYADSDTLDLEGLGIKTPQGIELGTNTGEITEFETNSSEQIALKQASLQDITRRMEHLSVSASLNQ